MLELRDKTKRKRTSIPSYKNMPMSCVMRLTQNQNESINSIL